MNCTYISIFYYAILRVAKRNLTPQMADRKKYALKNRDFSIFCIKKKIFCTLSSTFMQNIWLMGLFEFMLEMLK